MKTLKELKQDPRVAYIGKVSSGEYQDESIKYIIELKDGYTFNGWGATEYATSVKDLNEIMNDIKKEV